MFPIQENSLPIYEIADFWAREIEPKASPEELQNRIETAWWRGEIGTTRSRARIGMLGGLILACRESIVFLVGNVEGPPVVEDLDDGSALIDIRPRVPLPSSAQNHWVDEDCVETFNIIAEKWSQITRAPGFALVVPGMRAVQIIRKDFQRWVDVCGYRRPSFWGRLSPKEMQSSTSEVHQLPSDDDVRVLIRTAMAKRGGFVGQAEGAKYVRQIYPGFNKKHAMALVKELTGNEKPGPKGPRINRAVNRA